MDIKTFIYKIPDLYQKNYVIQPYYVEDNVYIFIYRTMFRDPDLIMVDIYRDELTSANKIYSGLKLTADAVLCLPNFEANFPYGVRCMNQYGFDKQAIPEIVSTEFVIEFENVITSDYEL